MKTCSNVPRSHKLIFLAMFCVSLDITFLTISSNGLAKSHGQRHSLYLAGAIVTGGCFFVIIYFLKYAYRVMVKEQVQGALKAAERVMEADAEFLKTFGGLPTRFSFQELDMATNGFSKKLGRGGFGSVYEGTAPDGSKVAVKRLEKIGSGQKEFCAEVATISKIRHINLVCLKGFCTEGAERLLVYEFMPKGSLDRWIFHSAEERVLSSSSSLSSPADFVVLNWETRWSIALDSARGLAYLHEECEETILHLDVKPQNILLDERFRAKVSDFGLSRSMDRAQSRVMTDMRGTPGYLAPEWLSEAGIDSKADVYSFGMVVLELVSGRRSVDQSQENPEDWFLPAMAFKKLQEGLAMAVVDPLLQHGRLDEKSCKQATMMIKLGLWCVQADAAMRPSMSSVVQMLEGKIDVKQPPSSRNFLSRRAENSPLERITIIHPEPLSFPR